MTFCCEARGDCVQYFCEGEVLCQHRGPCGKGGSQAPLGAQDEGGSGLREREELRRLALLHNQAVRAPSGGRGRQGGCWTRRGRRANTPDLETELQMVQSQTGPHVEEAALSTLPCQAKSLNILASR